MKKKISFVLATIMLVANFAISAIAADTNISFNDVTNATKYSKAILTMVQLGVVNGYSEDNTFRPEAAIKRSEFTAIITRAMRIVNAASGESPFTDVPADHWALKNIIAASSREIVNGMGDGTFHPEDNVTYEQALKMVVCALNYKNAVELAGGWNAGAYFNKAVELGLTKDVGSEAVRDIPTSRGVVAQIMYNALDVLVADAETSKATEDTFLNEFLKMGKVEGTIVGVETDVTAECSVNLGIGQMAVMPKNGEIKVLDFTQFGDKASVLKHMGQEAVLFYNISQNGETDKLAILDIGTTKNDEIKISHEDVVSYKSGLLSYYDADGRKTNAKIDEANITVFYNKKAVTSNLSGELDGWLNPSDEDFIYGDVVLKDSGSDGTVDMIEIMDYEYMVSSKTVSSADFTVTNKMKFKDKTKSVRVIDSVVLNPDKNSYSFTIEGNNGANIEPTGIAVNSVVMVAKSKNEDMITVKVSTNTVEGKINAYSEDDKTIYIKDTEYKLTDDCVAYFEDQGTEIANGKKGKFYLDSFGNIAYGTLNVDTDTTVLAYLITAVYYEDTDSGELRVFVPGSGYKPYKLGNKVLLNGLQKGAEVIKEELDNNANYFDGESRNATSNSPSNQLIKMEVVEGEVTEITTINTSDIGAVDENSDFSGLKLYHGEPKLYKYNGNVFIEKNGESEFYANASTIFIGVPGDRTKTNAYNKRSKGWFQPSNNEGYLLELINVTDSVAEIVVIYETEKQNTVQYSTPISVLSEDVKNTASSDGDIDKKLIVFTNPATKNEPFIDLDSYAMLEKDGETKTSIDELEMGDIIRYVKTNDGKATDIRRKIKYSDIDSVLSAGLNDGAGYDWSDDKFEFETNINRPYTTIPYISVYMYNVISVSKGKTEIKVTRNGFVGGELDQSDFEWVNVTSSTKYLKISNNGNKILSKNEFTEQDITIEDILTAEYDGEKCSKIAVVSHNSANATMIIIYE